MKNANPAIRNLLSAFACAGGLLLPATSQAAVTFVGVESGASPYAAQLWSDPGVAKTYDVSGNVFGTSGYYILAPTTNATDVYQAVTAGDLNAGPTSGQMLTQKVKPTFLIGEVQSLGGVWVNFPGYSAINQPNPAAPLWRVGGISMTTAVAAGNIGTYTDVAYFTVAAGADFRFGIMTDATGGYGANAISIYDSSANSSTYSTSLTPWDGAPELVLFNIKNTSNAATQYNVALHSTGGLGTTVTYSMLTFDAIPEPNAALLGGLGLLALLRRRRA